MINPDTIEIITCEDCLEIISPKELDMYQIKKHQICDYKCLNPIYDSDTLINDDQCLFCHQGQTFSFCKQHFDRLLPFLKLIKEQFDKVFSIVIKSLSVSFTNILFFIQQNELIPLEPQYFTYDPIMNICVVCHTDLSETTKKSINPFHLVNENSIDFCAKDFNSITPLLYTITRDLEAIEAQFLGHQRFEILIEDSDPNIQNDLLNRFYFF